MKLTCPKCSKPVDLVLSKAGPHIKASCFECGAYIKFISEQELTGERKMAGEFEIVVPVDGSEYGDCVMLQKYGDKYQLLAGQLSKKPNGSPWMRWVFPQDKDKQPREKAIPLQINLGNLVAARSILAQLLSSLPIAPGQPKQSKISEDQEPPF
jgi:hypothetical protein